MKVSYASSMRESQNNFLTKEFVREIEDRCPRQESNPQPLVPKTITLSIELRGLV